MSRPRVILAEQARRLAAEMPPAMVEMLADAVEGGSLGDGPALLGVLPQPHYRALAGDLLSAWKTSYPEASPQAVALALSTAAAAEQARREGQLIELVWTGPDTQALPLRRTEQVLLQVIDAARERVALVSYAVYDIPHVREALIRAADRGVATTLVVETPDRLEGRNTYDTLRALGPAVAARSDVYLWPLEQRPRDGDGKPGSMHVKCAVADGRWLFLSSANLTGYAFTLNMELGVLITGGPLPGQVETHLERLIATGVLRKPE
jgi:phosphatidylserine/phosphatidylglycerophosphate/cardiolipin synthase-like enzyme